jgi:hypothetical protein
MQVWGLPCLPPRCGTGKAREAQHFLVGFSWRCFNFGFSKKEKQNPARKKAHRGREIVESKTKSKDK